MTAQPAQGQPDPPDLEAAMREMAAADQLVKFAAQPPLRPHELNQQQRKARYLLALKEHGTISASCAATGIPRRTVYNWREDDAAFEGLLAQWLYVDMEAELIESMYSLATEGARDPKRANAAVRAAELILKSTHPTRYSDKHIHSHQVTINQSVVVLDAFREDQRRTLNAILNPDVPSTLNVLPSVDSSSVEPD